MWLWAIYPHEQIRTDSSRPSLLRLFAHACTYVNLWETAAPEGFPGVEHRDRAHLLPSTFTRPPKQVFEVYMHTS